MIDVALPGQRPVEEHRPGEEEDKPMAHASQSPLGAAADLLGDYSIGPIWTTSTTLWRSTPRSSR